MNTQSAHTKQEEVEDKVSTVIIILVCMVFLGFIAVQTFDLKGGVEGLFPPKPAASGVSDRGVATSYDCPKHNGDFEACVKAQTSGKGCSWYSDCKKCIVEDFKPKTREMICGK